jgi:hypothetical protein
VSVSFRWTSAINSGPNEEFLGTLVIRTDINTTKSERIGTLHVAQEYFVLDLAMGHIDIIYVSVIAVTIFITYKLLIEPLLVSPLSKIPSAHPSAHISPFWIYYVRYTNTENRTLYELHRTKGPILRLAPNELSINCYEQGLKTVYTGGFEKTEFYPRRFHNYNGSD